MTHKSTPENRRTTHRTQLRGAQIRADCDMTASSANGCVGCFIASPEPEEGRLLLAVRPDGAAKSFGTEGWERLRLMKVDMGMFCRGLRVIQTEGQQPSQRTQRINKT